MGVDRAYVSGLELGQRNPTIVTLWHIAKARMVERTFISDTYPDLAPNLVKRDMALGPFG
jgi:transcriptional regulator with XRE-family HTH domain